MNIKELHKILGKIITKHPECAELPVRVFQDSDCENCISINYWLNSYELAVFGKSVYETSGELLLTSSE